MTAKISEIVSKLEKHRKSRGDKKVMVSGMYGSDAEIDIKYIKYSKDGDMIIIMTDLCTG